MPGPEVKGSPLAITPLLVRPPQMSPQPLPGGQTLMVILEASFG